MKKKHQHYSKNDRKTAYAFQRELRNNPALRARVKVIYDRLRAVSHENSVVHSAEEFLFEAWHGSTPADRFEARLRYRRLAKTEPEIFARHGMKVSDLYDESKRPSPFRPEAPYRMPF